MSGNTGGSIATLALTGVGAYFGGPFGASLGSAIGGMLFPPQLPDIEGQRLGDLQISSAAYGNAIPLIYGTVRVATTLIWTSGRKTTRHVEEAGGKGGPSQTTTSYTYSLSAAFAIGEGVIEGLRRVWINGKLMWDVDSASNQLSVTGGNALARAVTFYSGAEDQEPSSLQESHEGAGNVPAYRGLCFVEFDELQLEQFGNGMVNVEVEVVRSGIEKTPPWAMHDLVTLSTEEEREVGLLEGNTVLTSTLTKINDYTHQLNVIRYDLQHNALQAEEFTGQSQPTASGGFLSGAVNDPYFVWQCSIINGDSQGAMFWYRYKIDNTYRRHFVRYPGVEDNGPLGTGDSYLFNNYGQTLRCGDYYFTIGGRNTNLVFRFPIDPLTGAPTHTPDITISFTDLLGFPSVNPNGNPQIHEDMSKGNEYFFIRTSQTDAADRTHELIMLDLDVNIISYWPESTFALIPILARGLYSSNGACMVKQINTSNILNYWTFDAFTSNSTWTLAGTHLIPFPNNYNNVLAITDDWVWTSHNLVTRSDFVALGSAPVADVITDLLGRVDITPSQIDVSGLSRTVNGYFISQSMSVRNALEPLQPMGFFDVAEVDSKLVFTERGGSPYMVIPQDDLAAVVGGTGKPDDMEIKRAGELELPKRVSISYMNPDDQYEINTQHATRIAVEGLGIQNAQLPIVMRDQLAATTADTMLYSHYAERQTIEFRLSTKYVGLIPNDVVTVGDDAHRVRITEITQDLFGALRVTGTIEDERVYTSYASAVEVISSSVVAAVPGLTMYRLMNLPLLRQKDDTNGFYYAADELLPSWEGAILYNSIAGSPYVDIDTVLRTSDIAVVTSSLVTTTNTTRWNWDNTITVRVISGDVLSSDSEINVLNGANAAAIGTQGGSWEIIQWVTASAIATDTYRLSQLLRGRKGTEWAVGTHADNDTFVALNFDNMRFVQQVSALRDEVISYKCVTVGDILQTTTHITFANDGENLTPLSPTLLRSTRSAANSLRLTWERRSRYNYNTVYALEVGEDAEAYEVDFYYTSTLLSTVALSAITSYTYSSAARVADGASANAEITSQIFQISATIGRGHVATITG